MWRMDFLFTGLVSTKLCGFLLLFSTGFTSLSVLLLFPLSITFFIFIFSISSNTDDVSWLILLRINVIVFGDFNVYHKDWLTYSCGIDRSGKFCYNFSISNDLTHVVKSPTWIPDCDSHSPVFLDFFLTLVFVLQ